MIVAVQFCTLFGQMVSLVVILVARVAWDVLELDCHLRVFTDCSRQLLVIDPIGYRFSIIEAVPIVSLPFRNQFGSGIEHNLRIGVNAKFCHTQLTGTMDCDVCTLNLGNHVCGLLLARTVNFAIENRRKIVVRKANLKCIYGKKKSN